MGQGNRNARAKQNRRDKERGEDKDFIYTMGD